MIIIIRDDLHNERAGFFRAYTTESLDAPTCFPCIGYCSAGGSHRKMIDCIRELRTHYRQYKGIKVYSDNSGRFLGEV